MRITKIAYDNNNKIEDVIGNERYEKLQNYFLFYIIIIFFDYSLKISITTLIVCNFITSIYQKISHRLTNIIIFNKYLIIFNKINWLTHTKKKFTYVI